MVGVPAKQIGWISEFGERLDLPLQGNGKSTCAKTGKMYLLDGESLFVET
jgi:UDP-2-acetamido-3-amino-2,3-dideoxy-glucuronate N-acetyltransferase